MEPAMGVGMVILSVILFCVMALITRWMFRINKIVEILEDILRSTKRNEESLDQICEATETK